MRKNIFILINTFVFSALLWIYVNLNLTYTYEISVPLSVRASKSQGVSNELPATLDVVLKGKGWSLVKIILTEKLQYYLDLTSYKKDVKVDLMQNTADALGLPADVNVINISPGYIDVSFDNIITKLVKVKNNTTVQTREGFTVIGGAVLKPDSVKLTGAGSLLAKIKFLQTEFIVFKDINTNISRDVRIIDSLGNQIKVEPVEINVSYKVELSAEKTFEDIDVNVFGIPADKEVLIIPPKISITLRGGVEELSKLNSKDLNIGINYSQIESDDKGEIEPTIEISDLFTLIKAQPQRFQYIIKNKSEGN